MTISESSKPSATPRADASAPDASSNVASTVSDPSDTAASHAPTSAQQHAHHEGASWLTPLVWLVLLAGGGGAAYVFRESIFGKEPSHEVIAQPVAMKDAEPWQGIVKLPDSAQKAMGITTTTVQQQTDPILLPILGTTSHDDTKLSKVSPLFKGRAEKVYVSVGEHVTPGMPLVDLYSADLAQAKTTFEIEKTQWEYVRRLLEVRTQLRASNSISEQLLLDTQNDELRQRHEFDIAKEKLLLFGLTEDEIEAVPNEQGAQRARLTVRSPADGIVIARNAVAGNIYDESDVILVIAPNDHLWVWGNVFERDLGLVQLGQKWEVKFSFIHDRIAGQIEYISPNVDPRAHAVKVRTSIPNPQGLLKADMLVEGYLQIPPADNYVAIPRISMVVFDGRAYAFTRVPGTTDQFVRHLLNVVHEREDRVILRNGLKPGEDVVVLGSLILQQLHEEAEVLAHGHSTRSVGERD